jgi:membrane protein YdbS with pleckstrin-like domain
MRRTEVAVLTLVVAVAAGVPSGLGRAWHGLVAAGAVVGVGLVVALFVHRRVRAWGYAEREDDLLVRRGVMFSRLSVVPYGRMQFIDVTAGPVERSFGLATVRMHTAAAASDARIPGLSREEAARLRDRLAELGEAQAAGI